MPEPKLYSLQVKAELRFQLIRYIKNSNAAIDRIASSSAQLTIFDNHLVDNAADAINLYQQTLERAMEEASAQQPSWWPFSTPTEHLKMNRRYSLSVQMRTRIYELNETFRAHQTQTARMKYELSQVSTVFNDDTSFGSPDSLKVPSANSQARSPSDFALETWELDNDLLGEVQRSWVNERTAAVKRFEKAIVADDEPVVKLGFRRFRISDGLERGKDTPDFS